MGLEVVISIVTLIITLVTKSHDPLSGVIQDWFRVQDLGGPGVEGFRVCSRTLGVSIWSRVWDFVVSTLKVQNPKPAPKS